MMQPAELTRRVSLLEGEVDGEKRVSRHILRKVSENESTLLDLKREVSELRNDITLLRADLPGIIASVVGALLREQKESAK